MGYKQDQSFSGGTYREQDNAQTGLLPEAPPPSYEATMIPQQLNLQHEPRTRDSRRSSTDSLVPTTTQNERRKLLLIYIHGFMGNETSFASFPAHVHHKVTTLLAETHVVHTKLYPKYKSRNQIEHARDEFGRWWDWCLPIWTMANIQIG